MNHFSNNLKALRRNQGLSQARLSEATGIKSRLIRAYEDGVKDLNLDKLIILSSTLKISIDELVRADLSLPLDGKNERRCTFERASEVVLSRCTLDELKTIAGK